MNETIRLNQLETFGLTAKTLISKLDETFPKLNPIPEDTTNRIMYRAGQRSVVEFIYRLLEEETKSS